MAGTDSMHESHGGVVRIDKSDVHFSCDGMDTITRAGLKAGFGMPYECNAGGCGTCRYELVEGEVEDLYPNAPVLTERDRKRGRKLACQSRPKGEVTIRQRLEDIYIPHVPPMRQKYTLVSAKDVTHDIKEFTVPQRETAAFPARAICAALHPGRFGAARLFDVEHRQRAADRLGFPDPQEAGRRGHHRAVRAREAGRHGPYRRALRPCLSARGFAARPDLRGGRLRRLADAVGCPRLCRLAENAGPHAAFLHGRARAARHLRRQGAVRAAGMGQDHPFPSGDFRAGRRGLDRRARFHPRGRQGNPRRDHAAIRMVFRRPAADGERDGGSAGEGRRAARRSSISTAISDRSRAAGSGVDHHQFQRKIIDAFVAVLGDDEGVSEKGPEQPVGA